MHDILVIAGALLYIYIGAALLGETFSQSIDDVADDARAKKLTPLRCMFHFGRAALLALFLYGWPALLIIAIFQYTCRVIQSRYFNGKKS